MRSRDIHNLRNFIVLPLLALVLFLPFVMRGQTVDELQQKINARNADIERLEQEIASYQKQLDTTGKEKDTLAKSIKQLDLNKKSILAEIEILNDKIDSKNEELENLGGQIDETSKQINVNTEVVKSMIRRLREQGDQSLLSYIIGGSSISDVWKEIDNITAFNAELSNTTSMLDNSKTRLELHHSEIEKVKTELEGLKADQNDQKKIVDQNTSEKNALLKETKNKESEYQKILAEKQKQKDQFASEIREYENKISFILDPSKLPQSGQGTLSWPLDNVVITQLFGKTVAAQRLYTSGTHNGIDLGTKIGTPVKAMADGVIIGTGDTDVQCKGVSFGRFITIKYDNGLSSTFGHLSVIRVSNGDRVTRGQVVGLSGNTGYSTGPHLHVSVYANGSVEVKTLPSLSCKGKVLTQPIAATNGYLDPMLYLPPVPAKN